MATEEARSRRYGSPACVLVVDLDRLKMMNDEHGHAKGDELIQRAAGCIEQAVRETDIVARVGGDEFAVLAIECDRSASDALLANVRSALESSRIDASVGKAMRNPRLTMGDAMSAADRAMYEVKRTRRSGRHES